MTILERFRSRFFGPSERFYGLNDLDRQMLQWIDFDDGYFVEAGANDGIAQSNTYHFEKFKGWRGVLVEPVPELAERCRRNRPSAKIFNCALGPLETDGAKIQMTFCNLMSVVRGGMASPAEERAHIVAGAEVQNVEPYELTVPCRSLTSVLEEADIPRIDFMSLDVEGYEASVLQGMDFNRFRPSYLLVEARYEFDVKKILAPFYDEISRLSGHDILFEARNKDCLP